MTRRSRHAISIERALYLPTFVNLYHVRCWFPCLIAGGDHERSVTIIIFSGRHIITPDEFAGPWEYLRRSSVLYARMERPASESPKKTR